MSDPTEFRPTPDSFDKLYRGESAFEGAPAPTAIPWDIHQAQPRLMELEALGAITGEVLDIGCGLGDNAIFLASRGYSVTALDGSPAAIEQARARAAEVGATVMFAVADATELHGYDGRFDTVIDSALLHCLDDEGRTAYAAGVHRATRPGARWFIYTFSDANINGVVAPRPAVAPDTIRDVLTRSGWHIDFLGPTTYLGNAEAFTGPGAEEMPAAMRDQLPEEHLDQLRRTSERYAAILPWLDGDRIHLPFTVVHATRVG